MQQNTKIKQYFALFVPSATGAVLYTFFSGLVVVLNQFGFVKDYLQIPRDFNFLRVITGWLDSALTALIGQSRTETLVVGLFWAFVGLGVYVFLQGMARFILELGDGIDARKYYWPKGTDRNRPLVEAAQRFAFRATAFIGLVFVVFVPLARLLDGPVWTVFLGPNVPFQLVVWFMVLWLTLHLCVVLMRLVALKPRLLD